MLCSVHDGVVVVKADRMLVLWRDEQDERLIGQTTRKQRWGAKQVLDKLRDLDR
jgi:hypothetical protein